MRNPPTNPEAPIAFACLFGQLSDFLKDDPMLGVAAFALLAPMIMLWMLIGAYKAGHAIVEWHGNAERTLLLKVVQEIESRKERSSEPDVGR